MSGELVVRRALVGGVGGPVDVHLRGGVVVAVGPDLDVPTSADHVDAGGGALLPGLHDHHVHLLATAAERRSVRVGPGDVEDAAGLATALHEADRRLPPAEWIRATGYHEAVAGDLDRHALDRLAPPERPVRVQHRSGARWVLNSTALDQLDVEALDHLGIERDHTGAPTGRLHRGDDLLRAHLPAGTPPDLGPLVADLLARGVTGVTDATPSRTTDALATVAGAAPLRVIATGGVELAAAPAPEGVELGPVKVVVDDAHYPSVEELAGAFAAAHGAGRPVAVHCVTRTALALAVAAWREAGAVPGDRVEHGSVVPPDLLTAVRALGLAIATQPGFVAERGDEYLADVDPDDLPHLYRCRSLLEAGIPVLGSSDSPYSSSDPWMAIAAAVRRRTPSGAVLGPDERLSPSEALALFTADPLRPVRQREIAPGEPADLCLLAAPLDHALAALPDVEVAATIRAGEVVWSS